MAAFWGFGEETSNIAAMQQAQLPVVVRCQVRIPKQARRHAIWIPWSSPLFLSPVSQEARPVTKTFDADAARDELSRLGRVLGFVLDRIEAQASTEGLGSGEYAAGLFLWLTDEPGYRMEATGDSTDFSTHEGRRYHAGTPLHANRARNRMPNPLVLRNDYTFRWERADSEDRWYNLVVAMSNREHR